ncbi:MAG: ATP-binding protein [Calditrichaeota bacterium]|nr:ATP-binding protein [Spirochaetales bacterium]RQW01385.1 MAG: ATP-binding protein [Calditrichota bacterium]
MKISRKLADTLLLRSTQYPVVAIVGPRQSGKTTLVRQIYPEKKYISLEDFDNREFALDDPRGFLDSVKEGAVLDEIQRAPKLLSFLQTEVDRNPEPGRFILTGSNQFLLMKGISQSLAGRISINRLLPFSLEELKGSSYEPDTLEPFLYKGAYPRIYDQNLDSRDWYSNYLSTYFEKDLKDFIHVSDLSAFRKLLILLASSCGQLLNLSSIGNSIGISHNTVKSWISALEASYLVFLMQPYHKNYKKRIVKSPKIYFYDTGIVSTLLKLSDPQQLENHYIRGALFENWAVTEYIKFQMNRGLDSDCYFWRDHTGNEVDLLFERGGSLFPVEIKSGKTITRDYFKGLNYFASLADIQNSALVYGGRIGQNRSGCSVIPWDRWPQFS